MMVSVVAQGSFRDPSGFVFYRDGQLYRQINTAYGAHYERLVNSGLYQALVDTGCLIPHREVEVEAAESALAYKVIEPEPVPFVSYPYEWSFGQLKDAALLTLRIEKMALERDISLKDCSAYNVQFRGCRPVLIDTLSFEPYREGEPWVAYRQFCQHFLAPLALMSHRDVRLSQLLRVYIDGVPLDLASGLLPRQTWLDFGLLSHIHLHASSQKRYAGKPVDLSRRRVGRTAFLGLVDSLERTVRKLGWQPRGTEWIDYAGDTNYSDQALQHKAGLVSSYLDETNARLVWDLGANTGTFSRVAAAKGMHTVSADLDPACVEVNYRRAVQEGQRHLLPLVVDLTNPSPGVGWANLERASLLARGPADAALALALLHHLAIGNNLPLDRIARFFAGICAWLIVEFAPKDDSQVQRLLQTRDDIFPHYTQQAFEEAFGAQFLIRASSPIQDSQRTLYLMQRRVSQP
ncbi:MAG: SAM-dependent methyltransferase [Anaerolineae bacterium]|nr:SAM-dependent methyltransferase [Anaerolineae bacterium]